MQYPQDNRHEFDDLRAEIEALKSEIVSLKLEKSDLNIAWMRTSAELSDAQDALKRCLTELEIVASKGGHNACHIWIPELLKKTLGHTGNFLDPENMSPEQFAEGCVVFHKDRFGDCGVRLQIIKITKVGNNV